MNNKFKIPIFIGVLVVLVGLISNILLSTSHAQTNYTVKVAKTTEGDFNVTNEATYVGSFFETTYIMTGTSNDFIKSRDALTSSILDDFGKSTTIGYIKMNNTETQANTNMAGISNPFVSKEQIDQKIKSVLTYAIDKIEHPVGITPIIGDSRQVKCVFGNVLNDFWCDIPTFKAG
jgi:hypothetical protein